jgi:hypothetical protein
MLLGAYLSLNFQSTDSRGFEIMSCCSGWKEDDDKVNGQCPDCGEFTVDGAAKEGCDYSPVDCETCGSAPCDQSC